MIKSGPCRIFAVTKDGSLKPIGDAENYVTVVAREPGDRGRTFIDIDIGSFAGTRTGRNPGDWKPEIWRGPRHTISAWDQFLRDWEPTPAIQEAVAALRVHFEKLAASLQFDPADILALQEAFNHQAATYAEGRLRAIDFSDLLRDLRIETMKRDQPFWTRDWRKGDRK